MDSIEREYAAQIDVIRLNIQDPVGKQLGAQYGFQYTPTFILIDPEGQEILRSVGAIDPQDVRQALGEP